MLGRSMTFHGSCRFEVDLALNSEPKVRTEILRSVGTALQAVGYTADVGINITKSMEWPTRGCSSDLAEVGTVCLPMKTDAVVLMGTLRLDVSPITDITAVLKWGKHSDLSPISTSIVTAVRKVSGVYWSSINLTYVSNSSDRERLERERARSGLGELGRLPYLIKTLRNTDSGKLPMLKFEWQAPTSESRIHSYDGELFSLDRGTMEPWSGGGTPDYPYVTTAVVFSGNGSYGLTSLQQFKFRVRAVNVVGYGHWSEWSSLSEAASGFCLDAPATPSNLRRHSDAPMAGFVKLEWNALVSEHEAGGGGLAHVTYEVWGGPSALVRLKIVNAAATAHNQSVPIGQSWRFKVRSMGQGGRTSFFSSQISLDCAGLPNNPKLIRVTSKHPWEVVLFWEEPDYNGAPILGYEVSNDGFQDVVVELGGAVRQYMFTGMPSDERPTAANCSEANGPNGSTSNCSQVNDSSRHTSLPTLQPRERRYSVRAVSALGRGLPSSALPAVVA